MIAGRPVGPYNPKTYAHVDFNITDEKGGSIFEASEKVSLDRLRLPSKKNMRIKFNNCRLAMKKVGPLPTYTVTIDTKDKDEQSLEGDPGFQGHGPGRGGGPRAHLRCRC